MSALEPSFIDKLDSHHTSQVQALLKFFKLRLQSIHKEISHSFNDTKEMNLNESVYTAEDVSQTIDSQYTLVRADIQAEFEKYTNQTVQFITHMFQQAEAQGVHINVDPSMLDDQQLLGIIKQFSELSKLDQQKGRLTTISSDIDVSLIAKNKDYEQQVKSLESHVSKLQEQMKATHKTLGERDLTVAELEAEKLALMNDLAKSTASNNTQQLTDQITALRTLLKATEDTKDTEIKDLKERLDLLRAELTGKIHATVQYQQLQRMVQDKNKLLKDLRTEVRDLQEKNAQ